MKIAMLIPNLNIAGAQMMAVELLSELVKTDNEFMVVIFHKPQDNFLTERIKQMNIKTNYIFTEKRGYIIGKIDIYQNLERILSNWQPDIIHAHILYYYAWPYSLQSKKSIIETMHSQPCYIKNMITSVLYGLLRRKKLIYPVVLSKSNAYEFCQLFHESESNVCIIPNPINCEKFSAPNRTYSSRIINYIFVARFEEIKNHDMLIKAFFIAEKKVPNICLKLVGDGTLLEKEKQLVKKMGIESKVVFMGQRRDIPEILRESDVCVISSKSEAFPISLIEAMAAGLPVIATAVGGMRDMVDGNGYLVNSDDENAFADAMINMAIDEKKRKLMGEKSAKMAKQYNTPLIAKQYEDLYKKCARGQ